MKEQTYKLSLSGGEITVRERPISEEVARTIMTMIMGGNVASGAATIPLGTPSQAQPAAALAGNTTQTPKAFMASRKPGSGIERVTCLAYFLANQRGTTQFKTRDLTKLNTEAAQPKLSNTGVFARDAVRAQYLSRAGRGVLQITVLGEAVVDALPDTEKVKLAIANNRVSRTRRARKKKKKQ
jgi:hypothetical protein